MKTECCQFGKLTGIDDIEENLLNDIENDAAENVTIFFSLGHLLHNKKQIWHWKKAGGDQFPSNTIHASNRKMLVVVFHGLSENYPSWIIYSELLFS